MEAEGSRLRGSTMWDASRADREIAETRSSGSSSSRATGLRCGPPGRFMQRVVGSPGASSLQCGSCPPGGMVGSRQRPGWVHKKVRAVPGPSTAGRCLRNEAVTRIRGVDRTPTTRQHLANVGCRVFRALSDETAEFRCVRIFMREPELEGPRVALLNVRRYR